MASFYRKGKYQTHQILREICHSISLYASLNENANLNSENVIEWILYFTLRIYYSMKKSKSVDQSQYEIFEKL